ncbi:fructosamine kinase family protein [Thauera butanivorans]|uniref:fructosamine kinase family protein n=1 Tax=Thauera butanivorans TaxID=86174 RepID=UPI00083983AC|nr:fructosamine kinase family protein [Thauera butanivorans]
MTHPALPAVEAAIRQRIGNRFHIRNSQTAGAGIDTTAIIADGSERFFVKLGSADRLPMFEAEIDGLLALAAAGSFRTPTPIASGGDGGAHAFLVLEHLELHPLQSAEHGSRFADALVALHQTTGPHFGWRRDNFIGSTPQCNTFADNWALFFTEHRLRPQFALARSRGFGGELQKQGERLFDRVPALFLDYRPRESLLHGDLWHGNAAVLADGTPTIYDPAVHYGDRESDLAMSELFGGFPGSFYARYRTGWALDEGYETRKQLYSLYHMLNHLNLFGRGYLGEALRLATRLNQALALRRD